YITNRPSADTKSGFASFLPARARRTTPPRGASRPGKTDRKKANRESRTLTVPAVHKSQVKRLFRAENRVLQRFGSGETKPGARRNLDLLTGGRIATHARLGLALAEDTEAGQPQRSFLLELADDQCVEFLEHGLPLLLGESELFSHVGCYLRLRHHPPPCVPGCGLSVRVTEWRANFKGGRQENRDFFQGS